MIRGKNESYSNAIKSSSMNTDEPATNIRGQMTPLKSNGTNSSSAMNRARNNSEKDETAESSDHDYDMVYDDEDNAEEADRRPAIAANRIVVVPQIQKSSPTPPQSASSRRGVAAPSYPQAHSGSQPLTPRHQALQQQTESKTQHSPNKSSTAFSSSKRIGVKKAGDETDSIHTFSCLKCCTIL